MNTQALEKRLRGVVDSLWGAMLGAAVYGAWVVVVNWDAGHSIALTAGAAHWLMSTFLTYYGTALMRQCFAFGGSVRDGALMAFSGGLAFTYALLVSVHHAIGTPHLLLTLAAGVIPNLLFCSSYALLLARTSAAVPVLVLPIADGNQGVPT